MIANAMPPAQHAAIHRLARQTHCVCPGCCSGTTARVEADVDEAYDLLLGEQSETSRPRRPARRPRARQAPRAARTPAPPPGQPHQRAPVLTPAVMTALDQTRSALGWSGWQQPTPAAPVSLLDLRNFATAGGARVRSTRGRQGVVVTQQGRRLMQPGQPYAHLRPLFQGGAQHRVYDFAQQGDPNRSAYVGTTRQPVGRRVLEHLLIRGNSLVDRRLRTADDQTLRDLQLLQGSFASVPATDGGGLQHLGEVILQRQLRPTWNDPNRLGFEEGDG
jgi:hypothetical protein